MHPQIERYLQQVQRQLKSLPPEQCAEELREMGIHLQALVEEGRERGLSENEAVKAAIAQFGSHRKVGRELCRVVQADALDRLPRTLSVFAFVMLAGGVSYFLRFGFTVFRLNNEGHLDEYLAVSLWSVCFSLLLGAVKIYTAISLRRLKPWAFWTALILTIGSMIGVPLRFMTIISMMNVLSKVNKLPPLSTGQLTLYFLSVGLALLSAVFCLTALVLNRESFFRAARLRSSR